MNRHKYIYIYVFDLYVFKYTNGGVSLYQVLLQVDGLPTRLGTSEEVGEDNRKATSKKNMGVLFCWETTDV